MTPADRIVGTWRPILIVLIGFMMASLCRVGSAQQTTQPKPMMIDSWRSQPSVVLGRPIVTWWDVKITGSGLMVGKFRFNIRAEGQLLATTETDELTLNGPEQRIRVILPPVDNSQLIDQLQVDISFTGNRFTGDLGRQILHVPFASKKVFMGLVAESRVANRRSTHREITLDQLKFETLLLNPSDPKTDDDFDYVKTIFASIEPNDFPAEPLTYCCYDLVVLMGDEFRALRKPQLEAILSWIKAGGSLYLEPSGVLAAHHVDFLNQLLAEDSRGLMAQIDSHGRVRAATLVEDQEAVVLTCGLGSVIVRHDDENQFAEIPLSTWKPLLKPLWKYRSEPPAGAELRLQTRGDDPLPRGVDPRYYEQGGIRAAFYQRYQLSQGDLLDRLMPANVRMVPLSLLALVLFAFVAVIGPVDYLILGRLGIRKLTWITFPLSTVIVTAVTVWLSNSYMAAAERRSAAIVCDLGAKGELVRMNRFELLFVASTRSVATEVEKGLFSSLHTTSKYDGMVVNGPGGIVFLPNGQPVVRPTINSGYAIGPDSQVVPISTSIQGRLPTHFTATQDLAKWTPQLNRVFSIPGTQEAPSIDWGLFELDSSHKNSMHSHQVPMPLRAVAEQQFGVNAMVACFHGSDGWAYDGKPSWRSGRSDPTFNYNRNVPIFNPWGNANNSQPSWNEADFFRWINSASVMPSDRNLYMLTSRTGPKGAANCEDLPLLDATDPNAWLLVVVVPHQDDFIVYRKLMRFID